MFARTDKSILSQWWWTIDRWTLAVVTCLIALGALLTMATSPLMADRLKLDTFYFAHRHLLMLIPSFFILLGMSLLSPPQLQRLSVLVFFVALGLLFVTLFWGVEIKGARRWLNLGGISFQASEFIKPSFALVTAWLLSERAMAPTFPGHLIAFFLCGVILILLLLQPDLGMAFVVASVWLAQFFLAGLALKWIFCIGGVSVVGLIAAYYFFPHVSSRIDRFLDPSTGDSYQVSRSLEAFMNGGLTGRGPGEGVIKKVLPDAHADFIFAVIGEEFGCILCMIIVLLFAILILRSFICVIGENQLFIILAVAGLGVQFGLQSFINMASSLRLIPTKGMTLPFVSYGGSSLLALSFGMGAILALTRRRVQVRSL
jgi:cell division protein FtsW